MLHHSFSSLSHHRDRSNRSSERESEESTENYLKWVLLMFSSTIMLGLYYLISMPASLRQHLKDHIPSENPGQFETYFQLMFTMAFLPGIALPFFAGHIVDVMGSRSCLLAFSSICCLGQAITSVGVEKANWPCILFGRLVFGIGFESLFVANEAFLASVFVRDLGMALGVSSAASFIGFLLSPVLSPIVANEINVAFSFWVGTLFIGVSLLSSSVVFLLASPKRLDRSTVEAISSNDLENNISQESVLESEHISSDTDGRRRPRHYLSHIFRFGPSFWLLCLSCAMIYGQTTSFVGIASELLLEQYLFIDPPNDCSLPMPTECQSGYLAPKSNVEGGINCDNLANTGSTSPVLPQSINVTVNFPKTSTWDHDSYVFQTLSKDDIDCTDPFWNEACTRDYCAKQDVATREAGLLMATPFIITVLTTFIFGRCGVDRAKGHFAMVAASPLLLAVAHGMLIYKIGPCFGPLIVIGLGFSMYISAVWPSVSFLVKADYLGTAFGIMTCIQAVGNALYPITVSVIYTKSGHSYIPGAGILFSGSAAAASFVGFILMHIQNIASKRHGPFA